MGERNSRGELVDGVDRSEDRRQAAVTGCDLSLSGVRSAEIIRERDLTRMAPDDEHRSHLDF